jgi:hypothetical protein
MLYPSKTPIARRGEEEATRGVAVTASLNGIHALDQQLLTVNGRFAHHE